MISGKVRFFSDEIRAFLGYVHLFITLGLEAEAMAFSHDVDGVIQYLALFPQFNEPDSVTEMLHQTFVHMIQ